MAERSLRLAWDADQAQRDKREEMYTIVCDDPDEQLRRRAAFLLGISEDAVACISSAEMPEGPDLSVVEMAQRVKEVHDEIDDLRKRA